MLSHKDSIAFPKTSLLTSARRSLSQRQLPPVRRTSSILIPFRYLCTCSYVEHTFSQALKSKRTSSKSIYPLAVISNATVLKEGAKLPLLLLYHRQYEVYVSTGAVIIYNTFNVCLLQVVSSSPARDVFFSMKKRACAQLLAVDAMSAWWSVAYSLQRTVGRGFGVCDSRGVC